MFTRDNTAGYTQAELNALNAELAERLEATATALRVAVDEYVRQGVAAHERFRPSHCAIVETGWRSPWTAPVDGQEFIYNAGGRARLGSLGGAIRRDPDMTGWLPLP